MFDPARLVSFDYKSTGATFLEMVAHAFDAPCLATAAFDALVAAFRNDLAEHALRPLAALVAADGLALWQVDCFEDTVHVALVPADRVAAFKAYWQDGAAAGTVKPALRRVQPDTRPLPAPRPTLAVDVAALPADPTIDGAIAFVRSPYSDHPDNGHYFDFSVWPPAKLPLPDFDDPSGFARRWRPVHQEGSHNIWSCKEPGRDGFRLAQIDDMHAWSPAWLGGGASLAGRRDDVKWMHGMLVQATDETDSGQYGVTCVDAQATTRWYAARKPLYVHPFPGTARCVIVEGDMHLAFADGPVTRADFVRLPARLCAPDTGVIPLYDETVVYFSATKSHLRMHWYDVARMDHRACLLDLPGRPDVRPGHGDWWIINHKTNQFGTFDIALMWNAVTDEVFAIGQGDIALRQPTIVYQRTLDRYLAVSGDTVALLQDFDSMYARKEKTRLCWETLQ